jgi:hypothetical protein
VRSIGPAVQRFARQPDADKQLVKVTSRETKLDPFKARINQRWNEGITDACVLQARGWTGGVQAVRRYVRPYRAMTATPPPQSAVPKARQITGWPPGVPQRRRAGTTGRDPGPLPAHRRLASPVTSFAEMMTRRIGEHHLKNRLAAVEVGDLPELRSFAAGIRTDQQTVTNGLTLPYSSGKVEGSVNVILKMLNRQMYGRASFSLLRKRVIFHPG